MTESIAKIHASRPRLHALDFLRGLCAIGVAAYHFSLWSEVPLWGPLRGMLEMFGIYGVSVFFILSGYSLAHAYESDFCSGIGPERLGQYFRRRLGRLGPLFAMVVLLSIAGKVLVTGKPVDLFAAAANLLLAFGLVNPASTPVVGGWSIGIEVVFYVLFPVLMLMRRAAMLVVALSVFATAWLTRDLLAFPSLTEGWNLYVHPANHFVFFAMGVFMRLFDHRLPLMRPAPLLAAVLALLAMIAWAANGTSDLQLVTGWRRAVFVAMCVGVVGLIGRLQVRGRGVAICAVFAGLSYPLYLIHPIVYFGLKNRLGGQPLAVFGLLAACAVLAVLADRFVDGPIQRRLKRLGW